MPNPSSAAAFSPASILPHMTSEAASRRARTGPAALPKRAESVPPKPPYFAPQR